MYVLQVKTALVEGIKAVFDSEHRVPEFRSLYTTIEFPEAETQYPSCWVDFEPARDLQSSGINHIEYLPTAGGGPSLVPAKRWRFAGNAVFTFAAMSSLERDRLYDECIRDFSFGNDTGGGAFRAYIQTNEFIAMDFDWDRIATSGTAAAAGTPWGTDDVIYETTIRMQLQGEFLSDLVTGSLLPLLDIEVYPWRTGEADPKPDGEWI